MKNGFLSEKERAFVRCYRSHLKLHGIASLAAREAGVGSNPRSTSAMACVMMHKPEVLWAIFHGVPADSDPTCLHCGKVFASKVGNQKYCSQSCWRAEKSVKDKVPEVKCTICLVDFRPRGQRAIYCSAACRHEGRRLGFKRRYKPRGFTKHSSEHWVSKAKVAIQALEELGIEI